jgi:metallothiol transferase
MPGITKKKMNFSITGINHITFSVSNLDKSCEFYEKIFNIKPEYRWEQGAYYNLCGYWLALNEEKNIPRNEIKYSYTHIAFSVPEEDFDLISEHFEKCKEAYSTGRTRDEREKKSVYFQDPDGHKFEFHCGEMKDRLKYFNEIKK